MVYADVYVSMQQLMRVHMCMLLNHICRCVFYIRILADTQFALLCRRRTAAVSIADINFPPAFQNLAYDPSDEPQDQAFDDPNEDYEELNQATMARRHCI